MLSGKYHVKQNQSKIQGKIQSKFGEQIEGEVHSAFKGQQFVERLQKIITSTNPAVGNDSKEHEDEEEHQQLHEV
jgi:hypothetical protein